MKKFLFTIPITFLFGLLAFHFSISDSFALATTSSEVLWGSFAIASEYYLNHAGQTISGAEYGLNDINNPMTASDTFGSAYGGSIGLNIPSGTSASKGQYIFENGQVSTVDLSSMPATQATALLTKLIPDYDGSDNYRVDALKIGGITLMYGVEKATQNIVAEKWSNICAKFDTLTSSDVSNINTYLNTNYPSENLVFTKNFSCIGQSNEYYIDTLIYHFNYPVFMYTTTSGIDNKIHYVFASGTTGSLKETRHRFDDNSNYEWNFSFSPSYTTVFGTFDNVTFYDSTVFSGNQYFTSYHVLSSYSDVYNYLSTYGNLTDVFSNPLIDSQGLPYEVPSLRDTASSIGDIFPALQGIREGILTVPAVGELATSIPATKADAIADAIAEAIAKGISIPDVKEDDEDPDPPVPEDPIELPDWIVPSFIPDLLPVDMFSMFQPVMDIVGSNYSIYGFWIALPTILIFLFILYIIVSVL